MSSVLRYNASCPTNYHYNPYYSNHACSFNGYNPYSFSASRLPQYSNVVIPPPVYTRTTQETLVYDSLPTRTLGTKFKNTWDDYHIPKKQNTGSPFTLESMGIDPTKLSQLITILQQKSTPQVSQVEVEKVGVLTTDEIIKPVPQVEVEKLRVLTTESHKIKTNTWGDVDSLFKDYDDQQKAMIRTERDKRINEQYKLFAAKKLCLVLDLDHTLLNSVLFSEVNPAQEEILRKKEKEECQKAQRYLFRLPNMKLWTKLRPGIWTFLQKASKLYELHICTMGNQLYAEEMVKLLDPTGGLFGGRVISKCGSVSKDLEGVLGMESSAVIMDDTVHVWPHQKMNLINLDKYVYFPSSQQQLGLPGHSFLELDQDERPEKGALASTLTVIERVHPAFFSNPSSSLDEVDIRCILEAEKRKVLAACRILFSRIFPVGETKPQQHLLWKTAEQFGAVCTTEMDSHVTHVVANMRGTDKVNWALSTRKFVVSPSWIKSSAFSYQKAKESDFTVT